MIEQEAITIILAVGTLLPLLTAVVEQPRWSRSTRAVMSVAISVIAGLVAYVSQHGLEFSSVSSVVVFVIGVVLASAASYESIWKPTGVASSIEQKTAPSSSTEDDVLPRRAT